MAPLSVTLVERATPALASELRGIDGLDDRLTAITSAGRAAFPDLPVDDAEWAAYLASHLREGEADRLLGELRASDVHLVLACLKGRSRAHGVLRARVHAVAPQALAGIRLGALSEDEVLQNVLTKLLVGGASGAKLATYSGRGPLDGWLRVTVARAALSLVRTRGGAGATNDTDALEGLAAMDDPQLSVLRARCGATLRRAIEDAVLALPPGDRALMRLYAIDGLSIDDLAPLYRAHRATMARRLARVRNAIFEGARARAMETLGLGEAEFASLMGAMLSRLDLTLARVLRPEDAAEP